MFPARKSFANKKIDHLSYRPVFELSCEFCQDLSRGSPPLIQPLIVADVGAAQGLDPRWEIFGESCVQIGFEPDTGECERLARLYAADGPGATRKFMEPIALWHSEESCILNVTRDPDASSIYEPNSEFFERLPDPTLQQVVARVPVEAIPMDMYELPVNGTIDVIKLDVQAAELDVIRGAEQHMENGVLAVIAELLFTPHYIDQPSFGDFDAHMRDRGYQVFDIDLRRWRHRPLPPQFDGIRVGGISYGDALYLKDPLAFEQKHNNPGDAGHRFCQPDLIHDKIVKLIALAEFFSLPDYAIEIAEYGRKRDILNDAEFHDIIARINANTITTWNDRNSMPG